MIDTVQHYLCTNHLHAMPVDAAKHHEPPQESVVPIYWRCKWKTLPQRNGFADYRCLDGVTVEVNDGWYWRKSLKRQRSELDYSADLARCNADGTPIADHIPDAGTMVEPKPDAPLKVGDWVELVIYDDRLSDRGWPREIAHANNLYVGFDFDSRPEWCRGRFRRVPPPSTIAVEQDRIAELTRERDEAREQFSQVRRVLVESLNLTEVGNEFAPPCVDIDHATSLSQAAEVAIDTLKLSAEKHRLDAEEAKKALTTVQAEAAAMRSIFDKMVAHGCNQSGGITPGPISYVRFVSFGDALACDNLVEEFIQGTAGRELLDEMRRKDERIAELERQLAEQAPLVAIARELRGALNGRAIDWRPAYADVSISGGDQSTSDTNRRLVTALEKLRDEKGGV